MTHDAPRPLPKMASSRDCRCRSLRFPARKKRSRCAVVGAGVIGLSAAVHLAERFAEQLEVTLVSDKFSPSTTGDQAGTLVMPVDWNSEDVATVSQNEKQSNNWADATFTRFHSIYRSEANADVQLVLRPGYIFRYSSQRGEPSWKDMVFGFRHVAVESEEARAVNAPSDCTDIWTFVTYILNCSNYLEWLMSLFRQHGGLVEKRKISTLDELNSYDIIINCTGLGSNELLGDHTLQPARGQILLVNAPWASHIVMNVRDDRDGVIYILPRSGTVALGGSFEKGNWSEEVEPETERRIINGCKKLIPSLSKATVVDRWAGLRPLRDSPRLERSVTNDGRSLIHCYGHGGQGVVLSWGCALDIGKMVSHNLNTKAKL